MALQKQKHYGSTGSLGSRGSLSNLLKDGVDNLEDSVTKKWLSWILRRHVRSSVGRVSTTEANSLADITAELTRELVSSEGLEVMKVPNDQTLFQDTFLFFRITAALAFRTTSVRGLATLERQGNAILELDGDWLTLQTAFTADQIECRSTCSATMLDIGPSFQLRALVDAATVKVKARINTATMQVIVCTCELVHVGDMSVSESDEVFRVVSAGPEEQQPPFPLTSLLAVISEVFVSRCRDHITQLFEAEAPPLLSAAIQRADLPGVVAAYGRSYFRSAVDAEQKSTAGDPGGGGGGSFSRSVSTPTVEPESPAP